MAEINTLEITDWNNPGRYCKACFDKRCILSANPFDIFGPAGGMCHATTLDSVLRAKSTNACIKHGPLNECLYQSWTMLDGGRAFGGFLKCRYVPPNHPNLDNFKNMLILKPMLYPWFWGSPILRRPHMALGGYIFKGQPNRRRLVIVSVAHLQGLKKNLEHCRRTQVAWSPGE